MGSILHNNLEHLPVFRAPREGRLSPRENAESVLAKKLHGNGGRYDIHTYIWTDIATTRPNPPSGSIWWKLTNIVL